MRRLVPPGAGERLDDVYDGLVLPAPPPGSPRATVALGMVSSVDGATAVDGASGGLGGDADRAAFLKLRAACDAILVGAGTVRTEGYRAPTGDETRRSARRAAGLAPIPTMIVVTGAADLAPEAAVFRRRLDDQPHVVVATRQDAPEDRTAALAEVARVERFGAGRVDLDQLLRWCRDQGLRRVLCEGGPGLNGALLAADLVDELFLTIAPSLVSGDSARIVSGPALPEPRPLELVELRLHDHELLARYRVRRGDPPAAP
jgi:riboflavin-specific deaminase-like protein